MEPVCQNCKVGGAVSIAVQKHPPIRVSTNAIRVNRAYSSAAGNKDDSATLVPFIPKRGEKDFEPIALSSSLPPSSKQATLSQHQENLLNDSRNAYFAALASGSRHHSSKGHNSFTWRPDLDGGRATCDGGAVYGAHFSTLGRHNFQRKWLELLPEEILYLVERGAAELWREGEQGGSRVPMSVQQTWDEVIGHYDLTLERYQVCETSFLFDTLSLG